MKTPSWREVPTLPPTWMKLLLLLVSTSLGCSQPSEPEAPPKSPEPRGSSLSLLREWSLTDTLATGRTYHTATRLPSGKVLVAGGWGEVEGSLASAEVYDPAAGTWSPTGSMSTARRRHTATRLPSGQVLAAGGEGGGSSTTNTPFNSAELYDPATGTWSPTGSMITAREEYTATMLTSGKVLVAGGWGSGYLNSAELYDPATGTWKKTGPLHTARGYHTATLLPSGKVLVAGGYDFFGAGYFNSAEVYDPATGAWRTTGAMNTARAHHTATLLPSGKVLVAGGSNDHSLASAELYDPATETWSLAGTMASARLDHTATLLPSGKVLVAGFSESELYDPLTESWSPAGSLVAARRNHRAETLPSGCVLLTGGWGSSAFIDIAEVYCDSNLVVAPAYGSITSDNTPTYSGTAEVGSTITVYVDDIWIGATTADGSGVWSLQQPQELANGPHTVRAQTTDTGDNASTESFASTFTVDTRTPAVPVVTAPLSDSATNDKTPTYSGTAEAGSTITVFVDGVERGVTTVTPSREWSLLQPEELGEAVHAVSARATDTAGNTSTPSNSISFTVDTTPPEVPVVDMPEAIYTVKPTITGTAEAQNKVTVWLDDTEIKTVTADTKGRWSFTLDTELQWASHSVSVMATDPAANNSLRSGEYSFTVQRSHYSLGCATASPLSVTWVLLTWALSLGRRHRQRT
ncbi:kelch repeat-containing protein [Hyalangium versicolor]|uniref:kelch repeat-containing protein n=1 Tax=Hyalangium versicolor TaxID=2861190 RepID=UPI001CCD1FD2|nr:kelch repeat-containing protein [Hyalangium versicolor]